MRVRESVRVQQCMCDGANECARERKFMLVEPWLSSQIHAKKSMRACE